MRKVFLTLGTAALVSACSAERAVYPEGAGGAPSVTAPTMTQVQQGSAQLARGLAAAMNQQEVRSVVRDALRASVLTEHKLPLRDFLATNDGAIVTREVARSLGIPVADVNALVASLPALDLYMPAREHRMTWRATAGVMVSGVLLRGGTSTAYASDGTTTALPMRTFEPGVALLTLALPESTGPRIGAQSPVRGDVIQDADDGELSIRMVRTNANGFTQTIDLANLMTSRRVLRTDGKGSALVLTVTNPARLMASFGPGAPSMILYCEPNTDYCDDGGSGGTNPPPAPSLKMTDLLNLGNCDGGPWLTHCTDTNEMRFTSYYHAYSGGPEVERLVLHVDGVGESHYQFVNLPMINRTLSGSAYIETDVWEHDGGMWGGDDEFDPNPVITVNDLHRWHTAGDGRSCPTVFNFVANCDGAQEQLYPTTWRQVNYRVAQ